MTVEKLGKKCLVFFWRKNSLEAFCLSMTGIVTDLNDITEGNFVTIDQISFQVAESKESFPNLCPNSRGM